MGRDGFGQMGPCWLTAVAAQEHAAPAEATRKLRGSYLRALVGGRFRAASSGEVVLGQVGDAAVTVPTAGSDGMTFVLANRIPNQVRSKLG